MNISRKKANEADAAAVGIRRFAKQANRQILLRYLLMYIAFLFVLFMVLFSVIQISGNLLMNKTIRIAEESIRTGMTELEVTLSSYDQTASVLMEAPQLELVASQVSDVTYDRYDAQRYYKNIVRTLENQPTCGFFLRNGTLLVSEGVYYSPKLYFDYFLHCEEYPDYEDWIGYIRSSEVTNFLPAMHYKNNFGVVTESVIYLIKKSTSAANQQLLFIVIPTARIEQILLPATGSIEGNLTITTTVGGETVVLYESNQLPPEDCTHTVTYTGNSDLTVRLDIADSVITAEMQEAWTGYYLFAAAFILIGLVFAIFLAYHNTRPVVTLMSAANQLDTAGEITTPKARLSPEFRYFLSILTTSRDALDAYGKELERHAAESRNWTFVGMLMGEDSAMQIDLRDAPYTLLLVRPKVVDDNGSLVLSLLRNFLAHRKLRTEPLCALVHNTIVILVGERDYDSLKDDVPEALNSVPGLEYRLVSIPSLDSAAEIRDAYAQAAYMLSLSSPNGQRIHETALVSQPETSDDSLETLTQFSCTTVSHLLMSGQVDFLVRMLDECIDFFRSGGYANASVVRYVYESCAAALTVVGGKFPDVAAHIELPEYTSKRGIEDLLASLRALFIKVDSLLRTYYEQNSMTRTKEIMEYIDSNLGNPDLYIKLVISRFDITESELQSHVRNASGMSFFNYVEKARMNEARKLIMTTDQPVAQIGVACGYNSNVSFTRAFTRFYGMSPSKMRSSTAD